MYLSQVHNYIILHASTPLLPPPVPERNKKSLTYQRGNQNPYIEEEQTTKWPIEKSTKGKTTIYRTYILAVSVSEPLGKIVNYFLSWR